ncbi:hypothetical protein H6P81_003893 [Aristolochia fimbriata]|uniref:Uncharacterized protein n=1 Tax=Aristolochia fimbriata TaxID=158543 RepID=A0AAV7FGP8_ARIFI|nr:hypothetical protein H6P81_003893 [Aristolochia fimbriata]
MFRYDQRHIEADAILQKNAAVESRNPRFKRTQCKEQGKGHDADQSKSPMTDAHFKRITVFPINPYRNSVYFAANFLVFTKSEEEIFVLVQDVELRVNDSDDRGGSGPAPGELSASDHYHIAVLRWFHIKLYADMHPAAISLNGGSSSPLPTRLFFLPELN